MTKPLAGMAVLLAVAALAEIPNATSGGIPIHRRDASAIQILLNESIKAGATNADGRTMITSASDPAKAITAAAAEWSGIASALINFLPLQGTTSGVDRQDGKFVLTIQDTPENRSVVGSNLGVTVYFFTSDGVIVDSDMVLNPSVVVGGVFNPFSTDHSNGSYDLQSLVAHELGHALGSSHTPVISATMFQAQVGFSTITSVTEATLHQALSADDVAFATTRYPTPTSAAPLGSIAGKVAFSNGAPVPGAMVVAVDPSVGTTIGSLASLDDGTYRFDSVPPGSYLVYAQPANGPAMTANFPGVPNMNRANTNFRVTFAGGNATPSAVAAAAGRASTADIVVDPSAPGMRVAFLGTGSAGGTDWAFVEASKASAGGRALDLVLWGPGLNPTVTADQIRLIAPGIAMRAGTLHTQANGTVQGFTPLRFTVDLAPAAATIPVTVAVVIGTDAAVYSGGFVIAGTAAGCSYNVSSKQFSLPATGGPGTVTVVTAGTACAWLAASGAPWLKITSTTAASGNGSVSFAADPNPGAGRSAALTVAGQTVIVDQAGASSGATPVISSVVNGASFQTGIEAGSWVTILGTNLANTNPGRTWRTDEIVGGKLPTALDGVSVTVNGKAAYVYFISPTQINLQAPTDATTGAVSVVVTNNGAVGAAVTAQLQAFAPAFFQYGGTPYAIVTRFPDNALVANPSVIPGTVAAAPGDVLILWASGFGPTNPPAAAGQVVTGAPAVATLPSVTIGGLPANVIGAALSPGSAGLYQIAIQVPALAQSGISAIRASVGGFTSAAGVNVFVQ